MSLILDALRKMEEDRKSRRSAAQDIRPEVLRYRAAIRPQQGKSYLAAAIGLVLLAAGIGAGLFLKGNGGGSSSASAPAPPIVQVAPQAPPASVSQATAASQAVPPLQAAAAPAAAPAMPSQTAAPAPVPLLPPASAIAAPASRPVADTVPTRGADARRSRKSAAAAAVAPERVETMQPQQQHREAAEELVTLPEIAVSGIAWQDERSLRRAVLNGSLVGEGAEVAGARVVEIRENRVRMSKGGQIFEIVLSSGGR